MRVTEALLKKSCRLPLYAEDLKKVPFKEHALLQISNKVTAKVDKGADVSCLQEMAVMFACMKKHDFREAKCAEEITVFNKCYTEHQAEKKLKKQRELSGQITISKNVKDLTTKQLNWLLAKYPQYNEKL